MCPSIDQFSLTVQKYGCIALRKMASYWWMSCIQNTIAKEGVVEMILDAMKEHESNADVLKHYFNVLFEFAL